MVRILVVCWDSYAPLLKEAAEKTDVELSLITFHPLDKDPAVRDRLIEELKKSDFAVLYKSNQSFWDDLVGVDTQNKPTVFHYRVNQTDEMQWNYIDVPVLVGYYVRGFHVGAGIKVSYALNPKTRTTGTYNLSATNLDYNVTFVDMPDRGYTDYAFDRTEKNRLNVGASLIGEIGYDLLSSVPTRSRICHVLKLSAYIEYGLNNQLRSWETPQNRVTPNKANATQATIAPYVNTFANPVRTVPFYTGVKLTYMIGGSRTARVGMHHGCMCYN